MEEEKRPAIDCTDSDAVEAWAEILDQEEEATERILALAEYVDVDPEEITPSEYCNDGFAVNVHMVRDGTSPAKAQERVAFIREVLERVIGEQTKEWNTAFLLQEQHQHDIALKWYRTAKEKEAKLLQSLPRIKVNDPTCPECGEIYHLLHTKGRACPKCSKPPKGEPVLLVAAGESRALCRGDLERCSDSLKAKAQPIFAQLDLVQAEIKRHQESYESKFTYKAITGLVRHFEPEVLKVGLHDFVNGVYFLSPLTDEDTHAKDHRLTLREAFNGEEIQDRTTPRRTNNGEYLVVTDSEADYLWDQDLENYIDECLEIPDHVEAFFDREAWKEHAKQDGRGHSLGRYDGGEGEVGDYFIYRQN
ncbi:MAG: hypothetical protein ACYSW0_18670 [Planctomycetota bacterium]|jgi:hypothetical protein